LSSTIPFLKTWRSKGLMEKLFTLLRDKQRENIHSSLMYLAFTGSVLILKVDTSKLLLRKSNEHSDPKSC
jgi:hypothetical protein